MPECSSPASRGSSSASWSPGTTETASECATSTRGARLYADDRRLRLGLGRRLRHRTARQHADEMRAIFGAAVNVARHPVGGDGHAVERLRAEALLQRLLERGGAEHAIGAGAGHRHADIGASFGYEDTNKRKARSRVREFDVGRLVHLRKLEADDDFVGLQRGLK